MEMMLLEDCCDILDSMRVPITANDRKKGPYPYYGANGIQDYVADYIFDDELVLLAEDGGNFGSEERPIAYKVSGKCWVNNHAHVLKPKVGIDVDYLCYSLMFYKVDGMVNGATRMKLTQAAMRKMLIPSRNIEEQKEIARILNKVQMLIKKEKEQIERLDELIKSRFVEMFGMPGTDVKGWGNTVLGNCCVLNPKKGQDVRLQSGMRVSFIPMPAISENGNIDASETKLYDEVKTGFTYFSENDVLFAKITPCMENGKGAVAVGLCNGIGFGSTEFHVIRPIEDISNPYWLYYLTTFDSFRNDAAANMSGSAGQRRVPVTFLDKYKVSLPPIELQNQFATFVHQTDKLKVTNTLKADIDIICGLIEKSSQIKTVEEVELYVA